MSTIHDKFKKRPRETVFTPTSNISEDSVFSHENVAEPISINSTNPTEASEYPSKHELYSSNVAEIEEYLRTAGNAMAMVDDVVLKEYLTQLTNLKVLPFSEKEIGKGIILFKIKKMVYEKDEFVTEKFISAISAMT